MRHDGRVPAVAKSPVTSGQFVLALRCPDRPGIVATVSAWLFERGANIDESQQFRDPRSDTFFMRIGFTTASGDPSDLQAVEAAFRPVAEQFEMTWQLHARGARYRTLIMVSTAGHCLNDVLFRWGSGELNIDPVLVVGNHTTLAPTAGAYDVPFLHLPVAQGAKEASEARLLELIKEHDIELVVLARYMQILSPAVCELLSGRIINIHHSFLPSFKGAKPYHQAFDHGVKLIGATAHYVTADLDEGPIIEQDVIRVDHRMGPTDLSASGREVEARVLSRAIRWHSETRVMQNGDRTVVFS